MTISTVPSRPENLQADIDQAARLFWRILATDARGAIHARDALKREFLVIGARVGPDFGPLVCARAGIRFAKNLELPEARYPDAIAAIHHRHLKQLIDSLADDLAVSGAEGRA